MPLTFAHPAAVLPLRRWLPLSALAVGAMMPDVPYFLPIASDRFGHTLPGLFWFCVPVGALILTVFHTVVKRPLLGLAPRGAHERLAPLAERFRVASALDSLRVAVALWVGAASHVAWDAFTHGGGWGVGVAPGLGVVVTVGPIRTEAYHLVQHASTLVGFAIMGVVWRHWYSEAPRVRVPAGLSTRGRVMRVSALLAAALTVGVLYAARTANPQAPELARRVVVGGTAALSIVLVVYGLLSLLRRGTEAHLPAR